MIGSCDPHSQPSTYVLLSVRLIKACTVLPNEGSVIPIGFPDASYRDAGSSKIWHAQRWVQHSVPGISTRRIRLVRVTVADSRADSEIDPSPCPIRFRLPLPQP